MQIQQSIKNKLTLDPTRKILRIVWQQIMISTGAVMSAMAYVIFQVPYKIAAGGVSGIGIIVNHYTGFPIGTFYLLVNVPLFILGYYMLGKWKFVWSSLTGVIVFAFSSDFFVHFLPLWMDKFPLTDDALLATIYAGILVGIGMGLIYRYGGTVGGSSITARIIYNKTGYPLSQSYLFTDLAIILTAGFVFSMETALLALLTLLLVGMFSDLVLEGPSQMRTLMIITEKPDPIKNALMYELKRGLSHWEITGGYTQKKRTMIFLTVLRSRVYDVKFIISRIDPDAFMVVGMSKQTWGGYNAPKIDERK